MIKKTFFFGLLGAVGCFLAAVVGEVLLNYTTPSPKAEKSKVDVFFALNITSSMTREINGLTKGIPNFLNELSSKNIDARVGLLAFGNLVFGEETRLLRFKGKAFTGDSDEFIDQVSPLAERLYKGGEIPESSLDAVVDASRQPFRSDANKVIILITDAPPNLPDKEMHSVSETAHHLEKNHIDQLHLVVTTKHRDTYAALQAKIPGESFSLTAAAAGRENFEKLMPALGRSIAEKVETNFEHSTPLSGKESLQELILNSLRNGILAFGTLLFLLGGQNRFLHKPLLSFQNILFCFGGSLLAGALVGIAGFAFDTFYGQNASLAEWSRVIGWPVLGAIVGLTLAFFIPNLQPWRGMLGGVIGGALGMGGAILIGSEMPAIGGHLIGAGILGLCLGLMVTVIGIVTKQGVLIVHWGPVDTIYLLLGETPVILGSSPGAHVHLPQDEGFLPETALISMKNGQIEMDNRLSGKVIILQHGNKLKIGNLLIQVKTS